MGMVICGFKVKQVGRPCFVIISRTGVTEGVRAEKLSTICTMIATEQKAQDSSAEN